MEKMELEESHQRCLFCGLYMHIAMCLHIFVDTCLSHTHNTLMVNMHAHTHRVRKAEQYSLVHIDTFKERDIWNKTRSSRISYSCPEFPEVT